MTCNPTAFINMQIINFFKKILDTANASLYAHSEDLIYLEMFKLHRCW